MISCKTRGEIELMRRAGQVVGQTIEHVQKYIKPGITSLELDRIADDFIRSHDCTPAFFHLYDFPEHICISINDEIVHGIPSKRVLKEGDIIALGGLITNVKRRQTSKVPVLSQIPIIGSLFQSRRFENNESELAIFLTPSIKRVPVPSSEMEVGAVHPPSWPKLSGIDDNSGVNLNTASAGQGSGGGQ